MGTIRAQLSGAPHTFTKYCLFFKPINQTCKHTVNIKMFNLCVNIKINIFILCFVKDGKQSNDLPVPISEHFELCCNGSLFTNQSQHICPIPQLYCKHNSDTTSMFALWHYIIKRNIHLRLCFCPTVVVVVVVSGGATVNFALVLAVQLRLEPPCACTIKWIQKLSRQCNVKHKNTQILMRNGVSIIFGLWHSVPEFMSFFF